MPRIRNGNNSSHTIGYNTSASKAKGQHNTSKMHHSKIFTIISLLQFRGPLPYANSARDIIRPLPSTHIY
jgi:hypothetical protein